MHGPPRRYGIEYELEVRSAHRNPEGVSEYAGTARERGLKVIICAAGMAAHLAGAVAARTNLPVIGIPVASGTRWLRRPARHSPDALPRATVVNGAANAAVLAAQILALSDPELPRGWTVDRADTIPARWIEGRSAPLDWRGALQG